MATAINETTPTNLADAAEQIGVALQAALGAKLERKHMDPLRQALTHLFEAATEAGGQQLEIERLGRYVERLEAKNSELTRRLELLIPWSERLLQTLAPALDAVTDAFNKAAQLKSAAAPPRTDHIRRGEVSDETLAGVREAPDMAHQGD